MFLVGKLYKLKIWKTKVEEELGVDSKKLKQCAKDLYFMMKDMEESDFSSASRKYSSIENHEVSKFKI
jgi:hypothetical protein